MSRTFNGTTDRADHTVASPITAYPFTFMAWVKPNSLTANMCVIQIQDKDFHGPRHHLRCAGNVASDPVQLVDRNTADTSFATVATTTAFTTGSWQHIIGIARGDTDRSVWLNGAGRGDNATSLPFDAALVDSVSIGVAGDVAPDNFYNGSIAHAAIWNIGLSDAQVTSLAGGANPLAIEAANLVAYWPLAGTASPEPDDAGSFDLTLTGTTQGADDPTVDAPPGGGGGGGAVQVLRSRRVVGSRRH